MEIGFDLSPLRQAFDDSELVVLATVGDSRVAHSQGNHGGVATDLRDRNSAQGRAPVSGCDRRLPPRRGPASEAVSRQRRLRGRPRRGSHRFDRAGVSGSRWGQLDSTRRRLLSLFANAWRGVFALTPEDAAIYRERLESLGRLDLLGPSRVNDASQLDDLVDWLVDTTGPSRSPATGRCLNCAMRSSLSIR